MEDELGGKKLEKHRNVHEVILSLLIVNLKALAVVVNRRDDEYMYKENLTY